MSITARALHGINVCLIPSPYNNDRPLVLRHKSLAFISALLIATKVMALTVWALTPATAELSTITVDRIVQLTNAERAQAGFEPLTINSQLAAAAMRKGNDMLEHDYFSHISPAGVTPWFWINQQGYSYEVAGENLAIDFTQAEDVVAAWIASPSHKENMLRADYTETGIAVVTGEFQGGTSIIVVHMFGKPIGAAAPATTVTPTPTPVPSPTPAATVAPPSPTPAPPGTPRIALKASQGEIATSASVEIQGDSDTVAHVLVNNQLRATVALESSEAKAAVIDVGDLPDGVITLRVYSTDESGQESALSDPLVVTKDTSGPAVTEEELSFLIPPLFDSGQAAVFVPGGEYSGVSITQAGRSLPVSTSALTLLPTLAQATLAFVDNDGNATTLAVGGLTPSFALDSKPADLKAPQIFTRAARRMTAGVLAAVLALLIAAVVIRIRIQHPALIAHASLVVLLALVLFVL